MERTGYPDVAGSVTGKIKRFLRYALWQDPNYEIDQVNCPEIIFDEIDQNLYAKLLSQATSAGVKFSGDKVTFKGCKFDWEWDAASSTLRITCTDKPFFITCEEIDSHLRELVEKAKGSI